MFLGGYASDMTGTKATHLQAWAEARGRAFLRFDYTGHGASSGAFRDGCVGDWAADAAAALSALTEGPQILVGSSMGGWIATLLARENGARVAGMVGVAAAPDFTELLMWPSFDAGMRARLAAEGEIAIPNPYGDEPGVVTRRLIEDGRARQVLTGPLSLPFPVRLLHGTADADVPPWLASRLLDHMECPDARLTLVKGADHRFSGQVELGLITLAIEEIG
ncbi:Serine aminopeptidase, S33 [Rubrimonas cliftonensis]|uniref:Palmitoyl-protein thioesterase ABHD10, mitochondrial n=2 Tax=Rubrimonas cliftonensis TaxID=89524 RepID=A0A1H4C217_9RHOB|nr:Serine aminopeptidase, S33 [Rubrimonas cliftonensis]